LERKLDAEVRKNRVYFQKVLFVVLAQRRQDGEHALQLAAGNVAEGRAIFDELSFASVVPHVDIDNQHLDLQIDSAVKGEDQQKMDYVAFSFEETDKIAPLPHILSFVKMNIAFLVQKRILVPLQNLIQGLRFHVHLVHCFGEEIQYHGLFLPAHVNYPLEKILHFPQDGGNFPPYRFYDLCR